MRPHSDNKLREKMTRPSLVLFKMYSRRQSVIRACGVSTMKRSFDRTPFHLAQLRSGLASVSNDTAGFDVEGNVTDR
jgi:hypothetical protein